MKLPYLYKRLIGSFRFNMTIHDYAKDGSIANVAGELAKGVDIEARDERNYTPLMHAVISSSAGLDMVQFLIEKGADPNASGETDSPRSVLSLAVGAGALDKITAILDAGANIEYKRQDGYDVLMDAMHRQSELVPVLKLLIQRGAKLDNESKCRESALKTASSCRFDAVLALLEAGSDAGPLKWTPLMRAIALGSPAEVRQQLDQDAELSARDLRSRTPWLLSLQTGDVAKAKLLLAAGANRADRGRCGRVPLMYTICNNYIEMLRWLLGEGFNPNDVDEYMQTPLMEAAGAGAVECARILIEAGADVRLENHIGSTALALTYNLELARLLVANGADLNEINDETRAAFTRLPMDEVFPVSREEYLAAKHPRFGRSNPEKMNCPFWRAMVTSGASAYAARTHFDGHQIYDKPVWCFRRFGKSINELPDGRIVEIAGEHEDHYDLDFYIYNDVMVHHVDGTFDIFGYPRKVFPPTDFHTATLAGKFIYIIGSLGYKEERQYGITQVYRLESETFKIEKVQTSGESPGWINRHKATYSGDNKICIRSGKVCALKDGSESYTDNSGEYILDLNTLVWQRKKRLNAAIHGAPPPAA